MASLTPSKADQMTALDGALAAAAAAGSNLLVLPELYLTGYNVDAPFGAEPLGGPSVAAAAAMAARHGVALVFTLPESAAPPTGTGGNVTYDTAVLIARNGTVVSVYRKVNLADGEGLFLTPGPGFAPVVVLDGVRLGLLICFDVFLPEPARALALDSVELLLIPTANGYPAGINVLSTLIVPARALENNAWVVYANWVQDDPGFPAWWTFHGQTTVAGPDGALLHVGPPDAGEVAHTVLNTTAYTQGSTAIGRPAPDVAGVCRNATRARGG